MLGSKNKKTANVNARIGSIIGTLIPSDAAKMTSFLSSWARIPSSSSSSAVSSVFNCAVPLKGNSNDNLRFGKEPKKRISYQCRIGRNSNVRVFSSSGRRNSEMRKANRPGSKKCIRIIWNNALPEDIPPPVIVFP